MFVSYALIEGNMQKKLRVGIVGCGAIGTSLAKAITHDFPSQAEVSALYDSDPRKAVALARMISKDKNSVVGSLSQLVERSSMVIEAASARSSWEIVQRALRGGCDCLVLSVGGIAVHIKELSELARQRNQRVFIPSGAIAGIDGLKAAATGKIASVVLTTRKPPKSFRGVEYVLQKGIRLENITKDTVLFFGSAQKAVHYFPQNINVAAVLSIAGVGLTKTKVKIIASPFVKNKTHEIEIVASTGRIIARTENVIHPHNPKTSYLAVASALATVRQLLDPVKVGN